MGLLPNQHVFHLLYQEHLEQQQIWLSAEVQTWHQQQRRTGTSSRVWGQKSVSSSVDATWTKFNSIHIFLLINQDFVYKFSKNFWKGLSRTTAGMWNGWMLLHWMKGLHTGLFIFTIFTNWKQKNASNFLVCVLLFKVTICCLFAFLIQLLGVWWTQQFPQKWILCSIRGENGLEWWPLWTWILLDLRKDESSINQQSWNSLHAYCAISCSIYGVGYSDKLPLFNNPPAVCCGCVDQQKLLSFSDFM